MKNYTHSGLCRGNGCLIAYAEAPTWDQGVLSIETRKMEGKLVSKVEVSHGGFASTRMESVAGKSLTFFPEWAAVPLYHFWTKACHAFLIDAEAARDKCAGRRAINGAVPSCSRCKEITLCATAAAATNKTGHLGRFVFWRQIRLRR